MTTRLITAPTTEPVTLAEVKLHLHVDGNDEDTLINALISGAREQCEHILGRSIMPQTWEKTLDDFPLNDGIELLNPSIISVTSIKYFDELIALDPEFPDVLTPHEATLASNKYVLDKDSEPGWVMPAYGVVWPATLPVSNAVRVRYVAGYADAASVPTSIKNWIKLAVSTWFKTREAGVESSITTLPHDFFAGMLDRHRIWRL